MSNLSKRSTIYFDPEIHSALRLKAVTLESSISALVDEAVREMLKEDQQDLREIRNRIAETDVSYEHMINLIS